MVKASETLKNQNGNRMLKEHSKTGHKYIQFFNASGIWMSGI
jgi:hypothetical protein